MREKVIEKLLKIQEKNEISCNKTSFECYGIGKKMSCYYLQISNSVVKIYNNHDKTFTICIIVNEEQVKMYDVFASQLFEKLNTLYNAFNGKNFTDALLEM